MGLDDFLFSLLYGLDRRALGLLLGLSKLLFVLSNLLLGFLLNLDKLCSGRLKFLLPPCKIGRSFIEGLP